MSVGIKNFEIIVFCNKLLLSVTWSIRDHSVVSLRCFTSTVRVLTGGSLTRNCHAPKRSARKGGAFDKIKYPFPFPRLDRHPTTPPHGHPSKPHITVLISAVKNINIWKNYTQCVCCEYFFRQPTYYKYILSLTYEYNKRILS